MSKGDYTVGWYLYDIATGGLTQEESTKLNSISTKTNEIFNDVNGVTASFIETTDSLHAIRAAINDVPAGVWQAGTRTLTSTNSGGATLAEIEASTVLAKQASLVSLPTAAETASAVRIELTPELVHLDANVSSRSNLTAEQVWTAAARTLTEAAGLTQAQADQLDALPTLAEIEASTVLAKESTSQAIKQLIANRYPSHATTNMDISDMDSMVLATFAEPFILQSTTGDITLQGVFDDRDSQDPVKTALYGDRVYILTISAETFAANDIAIYSTVIVREISYQVIDTHYDVANVMALILRKY